MPVFLDFMFGVGGWTASNFLASTLRKILLKPNTQVDTEPPMRIFRVSYGPYLVVFRAYSRVAGWSYGSFTVARIVYCRSSCS